MGSISPPRQVILSVMKMCAAVLIGMNSAGSHCARLYRRSTFFTSIDASRTRGVHADQKACLVVALQEAQKRGLVREGADLSAAADFIRDSIHDAMLRHTLYRTDPEAVDAHLRGVTDIFYRGSKA